MAKTAKIDVALSANAKDFKKELAKAEKATGKFSKGASKAFSGLKMAGIGVAVGLGAAFMKAGLDFEAMETFLSRAPALAEKPSRTSRRKPPTYCGPFLRRLRWSPGLLPMSTHSSELPGTAWKLRRGCS